MRYRILLLLLAVAVIVPGAAAAQPGAQPARPAWAVVTRTVDLTWYVDTVRITPAGRATDVWLRYDYAQPQHLPSDPRKVYSRIEMHERLDCTSLRATDLRMRLLDAAGTRLVAEPPVGTGARAFAQHPVGSLFGITCNVLEARRRGILRRMIDTLQQAPVPGHLPPDGAPRPGTSPD